MRNRENYFSLPFNPQLRDRARELRKAGNLCEVLLWQQFHKKKFKGFDFDRQKIIGNYIVDFYCTNCHVVIEIDGNFDKEQDIFFKKLGLAVIHISAGDVLNRLEDVMLMLREHPALRV